ncbi:MAG: PAS domain-containing protein [Clostridia bacterium]|nr:PAS domain-containing protein [Clostridia bacterium]
MFWKSLQLKLILIFVIFVLTIILCIGGFSLYKIEQVYYTGFVDEMLKNIEGYNFDISPSGSGNTMSFENVSGEVQLNTSGEAIIPSISGENILAGTVNDLEDFYNNFKIYFSLNSNTRYGALLDANYNDISTGTPYGLTEDAIKCIEMADASQENYAVYDNGEKECYIFSYVIENPQIEGGKIIVIISQSRTYINGQLQQIGITFMGAMIFVLLLTFVLAKITGDSITRPISMLTNKAELMAQGNISLVTLNDKEKAGYEISKLVDTFNLMMTQIQNNMDEIYSEKSKLETILMHLTDGVLAFNTSGKLIHANRAAKKMLEFETERTFDDIFGKYEMDTNLEKIIYLDEWASTDQLVKTKDKYLNVYFAPFRNEKDLPTGAIVVVHDTTKQAKLDDMRKEFVSNVSHELKTPLTSVKTYAETLMEEDELDEESKRKFLGVILTESNRMARLVSDLLQLTKFDYKKIAWEKIDFDITELTKQICDKHKIQAEKKNQILECYETSNVPMVFGDRDGIEQVITNILINSIKYTQEGGNIKVYIGSVHEDAYIKIIDNGMGIPAEDLPHVFERFYRVDKARSREMGGTGLGLPIAKEIIESNNGSIDIKSEKGKGTEVIIKIPLYKENKA